jgi:hypothetical protein
MARVGGPDGVVARSSRCAGDHVHPVPAVDQAASDQGGKDVRADYVGDVEGVLFRDVGPCSVPGHRRGGLWWHAVAGRLRSPAGWRSGLRAGDVVLRCGAGEC